MSWQGSAACRGMDTWLFFSSAGAGLAGQTRVTADLKEEMAMHAEVGDEIVVRGRHVGDEDRKGVLTEIHGEGEAPPYLVRWENGHQSVVMPSSDSLVERHPAPRGVG